MITQPRFHQESSPDPRMPDDDPMARLRLQLNELQAYVRQQWAARTDQALLSLRRLAVLAAVGLVGLFALAAWVVRAVVMLLDGAVGGLTAVLGDRIWLANLIVGATAMTLVILSVAVLYGGWSKTSKQRTKQKYERRQREQRRQFGRSAHDRASRL